MRGCATSGKTVAMRTVAVGMTAAARQLGVGYTYLWKVLTGTLQSPGFLLKVKRFRPDLFQVPYVRKDWQSVCAKAEKDYYWDRDRATYVKKRTADRRAYASRKEAQG